MAWSGVITNAGAIAIENYISSGVDFVIDTVKTGTGTVADAAAMRAATDMDEYADVGRIVGRTEEENGIRVQVSIPASSERYVMKEIGLFATLDDESKVLIAYYNDDSIGVEIPDIENFPDFNYIMFFLMNILNNSDINITVDSEAYIVIGDIINNLTTPSTSVGKVLDARQGKVLDDKKLNINQGEGNAGKFMIVDNSGNIVPTTVPFANGVNF